MVFILNKQQYSDIPNIETIYKFLLKQYKFLLKIDIVVVM